jgi:hypothetical protein
MHSIVNCCILLFSVAISSGYPATRDYAIGCISDSLQTPIKKFTIRGTFTMDTCLGSDESGKIIVTLPESSSVAFLVSAPEFKDTLIFKKRDDPIPTTIILKKNPVIYQLQEMTVTSSHLKSDSLPYRESSTNFTTHDILTTAGAVEDIGRYIGTLPSTVSGIGEGYDNTFFVRGGRPSEIVFLVDGIEMENINHFSKADGSGGPIGFINSEYLDNAQFFAGNMPAYCPPRLSSTVDLHMKTGVFSKLKQSVGCKLTGGMVSAQGPLVSNRISFIAAGRYVDFMPLRAFIKDAGIPMLYDVFGKIALISGDDVNVSTTVIYSKNKYNYDYPIVRLSDNGVLFNNDMDQKQGVDQGGAGVSVRLSRGAISHELHATASFRNGTDEESLVHFNDSFFMSLYARNPVDRQGDDRRHLTISTKSVVPLFGENSFASFGIRLNRNDYAFSMADQSQHNGEYVFCINGNPYPFFWQINPVESSIHLSSSDAGAFLEYCPHFGMLQTSAGLRADYFRLLHDIALSPRVSGSLFFGSAGSFSGNFGCYNQFPTDLPSFIFSFFSQNRSLSSDSLQALEQKFMERAQPLRCMQGSCGYDRKFYGSIETNIEAYYKWYDREYRSISPAQLALITIDEKGFTALREQNGERRAYGVELTIKDPSDRRLFYSVSGSLFDVKNRYGDGAWYDDWTNVRYTYSVNLGSFFKKSHMVSVSLRGSGGRPFCDQYIMTDCQGRNVAVVDSATALFSQRLGALFVANARYVYSTKIGRMGLDAFIEVLNIFNYKPTLEYKFNGERFVEVKPFGITPIVGCTVHL